MRPIPAGSASGYSPFSVTGADSMLQVGHMSLPTAACLHAGESDVAVPAQPGDAVAEVRAASAEHHVVYHHSQGPVLLVGPQGEVSFNKG